MWVGYDHTHRPLGGRTVDVPALERRYDPAEVSVPLYLAGRPTTRKDLANYYDITTVRMDISIGRYLQVLEERGFDLHVAGRDRTSTTRAKLHARSFE